MQASCDPLGTYLWELELGEEAQESANTLASVIDMIQSFVSNPNIAYLQSASINSGGLICYFASRTKS